MGKVRVLGLWWIGATAMGSVVLGERQGSSRALGLHFASH